MLSVMTEFYSKFHIELVLILELDFSYRYNITIITYLGAHIKNYKHNNLYIKNMYLVINKNINIILSTRTIKYYLKIYIIYNINVKENKLALTNRYHRKITLNYLFIEFYTNILYNNMYMILL